MKIPYDYIVEHAYQLIDCIGLSNNSDNIITLRDELYDYLDACGWTELDFDTETMRRINESWTIILN